MTQEELNESAEKIIAEMSVEDKIALCSGADFWHTKAFAQYGIPSLALSDGPNGLRRQTGSADQPGIHPSAPATCYPTGVTAAQTWNRRLLYEEGRAIGEEAREAKIGVVLGPGVNIKRNPLCGRNFEYYSEDPYVAGELGASYVSGMQTETGVGASLKHYACNSQEYRRLQSDSQVDERALREIYLRPFEKVVKKAQPATVMCAYNRVNGTYCSDNRRLLTDILREEWGFQGAVVTDWGALNDRTAAFAAGCDLVMPGGCAAGEEDAMDALAEGALSAETVDASARRVVSLALRRNDALEKAADYSYDRTAHRSTARRIAEEGAVLLKNAGHILPVSDPGSMVLIGAMAARMRYQGGGSSHVNPTALTQVRENLPEAAWAEGCDDEGNVTEESLAAVTAAAARARVAVVFAGLPESCESEGFDRDNLSLPEGHNRMIKAALAGNPRGTVVVLMGGSPMKLPWFDDVSAVLYMGLCGQEGGTAAANLLTGKVNPSGRLTETWPLEEIDIPSYGCYGQRDAQYRESIYVGYRYYEKAGQRVRFPFGFGLSYTQFEYCGMRIVDRQVIVQIRNTGPVAGSEVVQLYIGNPQTGLYRPLKELRAFEKVYLNPGGSAEVLFQLAGRDFALYQDGWRIPSGQYMVMVGSSSADIRLVQQVKVSGDDTGTPQEQAGPADEKAGEAAGEDAGRAAGADAGGAAGDDTGGAAGDTEQAGPDADTKEKTASDTTVKTTVKAAAEADTENTAEKAAGHGPALPLLRDSWYYHPTGQPTLGEWKKLMNAGAGSDRSGGTAFAADHENAPDTGESGRKRFDWNSSIADMAPCSRINRRVLRGIEKRCLRDAGGNAASPAYRMAVATSAHAPLRSLRMFAPQIPGWALWFLLWSGNRGRKA